MKRQGPRRYSQEEIKAALLKIQEGKSLSDVARDMEASKSTVSYWVSKSSQYLPEQELRPGVLSQHQQDFVSRSWSSLFKAMKLIDGKLGEASFPELLRLMESLSEILAKMGPTVQLQIHAKASQEPHPASPETRRIVEAYLEKNREKPDVGGGPVEQNKTDPEPEG